MVVIRGGGPGCNSVEATARLSALKEEIAELETRELELDQHKVWVQQSIKNVTDDVSNHQYPLVAMRARSSKMKDSVYTCFDCHCSKLVYASKFHANFCDVLAHARFWPELFLFLHDANIRSVHKQMYF